MGCELSVAALEHTDEGHIIREDLKNELKQILDDYISEEDKAFLLGFSHILSPEFSVRNSVENSINSLNEN